MSTYFHAILDRNIPIPDAIQQALGISPAQLEEELRKIFSTGRIRYFSIPLPEGIEKAGYSVTPITPLDAKVAMADMHLHSIDYQEKAVGEFQDILKEQPDNAGALRGIDRPRGQSGR